MTRGKRRRVYHGVAVEPDSKLGDVRRRDDGAGVSDYVIVRMVKYPTGVVLADLEPLEEQKMPTPNQTKSDAHELRVKDEALNQALARAREYSMEIGALREENAQLKARLTADKPKTETSGEPLRLSNEPAFKITSEAKEQKMETKETLQKAVSPMSFTEAVTSLGVENLVPGSKIGGATFAAKKIVKAAKAAITQALDKKDAKRAKRFMRLLDTSLGERVAIATVPSLIYVAARMWPSKVPQAAKVAAVAGYAATGGTAELIQAVLEKAGPVFRAVAQLADEVPAEMLNEGPFGSRPQPRA